VRNGEILVEGVSRRFLVHPRDARSLKSLGLSRGRGPATEVWALRDVSFAVEPGSAVGLVGRNGSGKSTLLRILSSIIKPTTGRAEVGGRIGTLLELGAGFHPDFSGRENVYLNGSILGLKRTYIREQLDEIVAFAGLEEFIDLPVRTYSSGMYMRLGFAIASHMDADILLLDEVFAVGDEAFQRKCMDRVLSFKRGGGTTVFVSHSASAVERMCERAVLLRDGQVVLDGETHDVLRTYQGFLADQEAVAEGGPDPSEWGTGEIRVTRTTLEGPGGGERNELDADEPVSLRIWVASEAALSPPQIAVELRDSNGGLLGSHVQSTADLGWDGSPGERVFRFELDRLPVVDGRFRFGVAIYDHEGGRTYHRVERAAEFLVGPAPVAQGWLRFSGRFVLDESASMATVR
jgi:ABC-type polysaccharide/polyol phosphate transport system ATPase subunit